jgi:hypothetical protein
MIFQPLPLATIRDIECVDGTTLYFITVTRSDGRGTYTFDSRSRRNSIYSAWVARWIARRLCWMVGEWFVLQCLFVFFFFYYNVGRAVRHIVIR